MLLRFFNLFDYLFFFEFFFFFFFFALILLLLAFFFSARSYDIEKNSPYECGFNPFEDAREPFEIQFYLVAILFIIFDLEISFLFPWVIVFKFVGVFAFTIVLIFLFVLTLGFIYELFKGALQWT